MKSIHVNQLGYRPGDIKRAVVPQDVTDFQILRATDDTPIFKGTAGEPVYNEPSGETVRVADFSPLKIKGTYFLAANGARSYPFAVDDKPYPGLRAALLDFFHYQKCGVDLDGGAWSHPACHNALATVYGTDEKKDVSGGWHDAGDFGRYIVPAAKAVADLLLAYELAPEPDEKLPALVWHELAWMLKMQDARTGGVYHKVSCYRFNALDEMPHEEKEELIICPISSTATAVFAAVMAMASRFYPEKRGILLAAANKAYQWLTDNPDYPMFKNPPEVFTGGYSDNSDNDERFWAICEMYAATGDEKYHDIIKAGDIHFGLGWARVGTYGIVAYLAHAKNQDPDTAENMRNILLMRGERVYKSYAKDPYGVSMRVDYHWGSNMRVANRAMMMLLCLPYIPQEQAEEYKRAALEHIHYLLGRNPLSQSYITGFGSNAPNFPHHRLSVAAGQAVPGMVVGGPNQHIQQDPILKRQCNGQPPAKCYADHEDSYSGNEVTIYWNSPVYFIMAVLNI